MLSPGSKGWINKYFNLIEKDKIRLEYNLPCSIDNDEFIHAVIGRTGLFFGYSTELIFARNLDDSKWTSEEKLKVLLFETLLFVYKLHADDKPVVQEEFIEDLLKFYRIYNQTTVQKILHLFLKESKEEKLENILSKRVDIKSNFLENRIWVNYLSNAFNYLDVILFNDFLKHRKISTIYNFDELAMNALTAISLASYSDGMIDAQEKKMFSVFLASANLSDLHRTIAEERFEKGASFSDFTDLAKSNVLLKRFILDLSAFVIFTNRVADEKEISFIGELTEWLGFSDKERNESLVLTEQFILTHQDKIPFLKTSTSVEKVYDSLSKRWVKILSRNKDKLVLELKQSKDLVALIRKSAVTELSREEKELVREQFMDIVKSMPSLAIFMLPGGAILLPIVLKVIPDLIPSAFRDNEVEK